MFELEKTAVHSIVSKMIINEELMVRSGKMAGLFGPVRYTERQKKHHFFGATLTKIHCIKIDII